ncbi:MAG: 50S ribosomal protein L35 [Parcubacteria group bacterium]|nr:50S ribosomal protein L35 [Parcubacteria group bacterium]
MTKTNKSYTKRLKITKTGKLLAKKPGGDHFNAKERRVRQLARHAWQPFTMKRKTRDRFMPFK